MTVRRAGLASARMNDLFSSFIQKPASGSHHTRNDDDGDAATGWGSWADDASAQEALPLRRLDAKLDGIIEEQHEQRKALQQLAGQLDHTGLVTSAPPREQQPQRSADGLSTFELLGGDKARSMDEILVHLTSTKDRANKASTRGACQSRCSALRAIVRRVPCLRKLRGTPPEKRIVWVFTSIAVQCVGLTLTPLRLGFTSWFVAHDMAWTAAEAAIDLVLMLDVLLHFTAAYYTDGSRTILESSIPSIAYRYGAP